MRDVVNKAARLVINYCLKNQIGKIIFGWNKGQKDTINLGRETNQKFVQTPTAKLKARIEQLCELYGIKYIETEESYTSQASFLDGDSLPVFGKKSPGWKASGKRVKRGLYQSADGSLINADSNDIRKVSSRNVTNWSETSHRFSYPLSISRLTFSRIWHISIFRHIFSKI